MSKPIEDKPNPSPGVTQVGHTGPQPMADRLDELDLNDLTVETRNLKFTYNQNAGYLLNDINITFPKSAIYGFLGPSGCGKTTIIKLIIGRLKPTSGTIKVNGKQVFDASNHIPGVGIGYMPQDYALYNEMTIYETLNYFANIYGLAADFKKKRIDHLIQFLELPEPNRMVGVLSGGQMRRTSLAIAIIHNPPFLILDEPTVGVDPVLRERVWEHLVYLSNVEKTSILLTTHYIEECRRAHIIALMRGGKLLVENSPSTLLSHFKTGSLEDVFLRVCRFEDQPHNISMPQNVAQVRANRPPKGVKASDKPLALESTKPTFIKRFSALNRKNLIKLLRQKLMLFVFLVLPSLTMCLVCVSIGKKPYDLEIAVFNKEKESPLEEGKRLSNKFLANIDNHTMRLIDYPSNDSARDSVKYGETFGAIIIDVNFTGALIARNTAENYIVSDEVIRQSTVQFYGDLTDIMIYQVLFQTLIESEIKFKRQMISESPKSGDLEPNPESLTPLIEFVDPPVYGTLQPVFRDFVSPGLIICLTFMIAMALTSINIVMERKEGLLDRTIAAGATVPEILFAEVFIQHIICIIQIIFLLIVVSVVFKLKNEGNIVLIFILALIQGTCGMGFGLLTSSIANSEETALMLIVGSFVPYLVISGILWPLEGMNYVLRTVSLFTPQTLPVIALRNIMLKGWGLSRTMVWAGYASTLAYIVFFFILAIVFTSARSD